MTRSVRIMTYGISHLPLSTPHIGTRASRLCGHRCVRADLKTQEPGEQLFKLVRVHPYPPSTAFSLRLTLNKRPDNAHTTNGRHSGDWIMGSHSSATVPLTTMLSPNPPMDETTPCSQEPSPPKNLPRSTSTSPDAPPVLPCSSQSNTPSLRTTPSATDRTSPPKPKPACVASRTSQSTTSFTTVHALNLSTHTHSSFGDTCPRCLLTNSLACTPTTSSSSYRRPELLQDLRWALSAHLTLVDRSVPLPSALLTKQPAREFSFPLDSQYFLRTFRLSTYKYRTLTYFT